MGQRGQPTLGPKGEREAAHEEEENTAGSGWGES